MLRRSVHASLGPIDAAGLKSNRSKYKQNISSTNN
jgi:hypothetical protein